VKKSFTETTTAAPIKYAMEIIKSKIIMFQLLS